MIRADESKNYMLEIDERIGSQTEPVDRRELHDPFIRTKICPRGWRVALAILRGRYELRIRVDGTREAVRAVMCSDYTPAPEGPPQAQTLGEAVNLARGGPAPVKFRGYA